MKTSMKWKSRKNSIRVVIESPSHQISKKHENPMKEEKEKKKKKINQSTTNQSKEKWKKKRRRRRRSIKRIINDIVFFQKKKTKKRKKRHVCHCAFAMSELLSKPRIAPRITGEKIKRERERERERERGTRFIELTCAHPSRLIKVEHPQTDDWTSGRFRHDAEGVARSLEAFSVTRWLRALA